MFNLRYVRGECGKVIRAAKAKGFHLAKNAWKGIRNLAQAFLATAARIGWTVINAMTK